MRPSRVAPLVPSNIRAAIKSLHRTLLRTDPLAATLLHMQTHREAIEAKVFERLKKDISRSLTNVCSEWSEPNKDAIVDLVPRTALQFPEVREPRRSLKGRSEK